MKLAVQIAALVVVLAGAAAASVAPSSAHATPSRQVVSTSMPGPVCVPGIPTCPKK